MIDYTVHTYPIKDLGNLLQIAPANHTMGTSLERYLEIKVHPIVESSDYNLIVVRGQYDRSCGISVKEKSGKMFNYIRPTAVIEGATLYINCFPGMDYVFHYGNIIKSYLALTKKKAEVIHILPTEDECWKAIVQSELKNLPKTHTVIMGYVEGLQWISDDLVWHGTGNFLWKQVRLRKHTAILLGCKHTYWGEIAGRFVRYLAINGVKRIIYAGKLGTLDSSIHPNLTIATGNSSILPSGETIQWENLFEHVQYPNVHNGIHITVPSVLQETTIWLETNRDKGSFVDPEIGHMALAAYNAKIQFSYFHIISDNLSKKFNSDLSNERELDVIENRKKLLKSIGTAIKNL